LRSTPAQLEEIRRLQFTDLDGANARLLDFFRAHLPLPVQSVHIRPLAVSLNSVNGFVETSRGRLFFKAHIESQVAGREYYNTDVLRQAGWPVLAPVMKMSESDVQHVLLYEVIEAPTAFDLCRAVERGESPRGGELLSAQNASDDELLHLYRRSLGWQTAPDHARAPIHQLFWHRLTGGRFDTFYRGQAVRLPGGTQLDWDHFASLPWTINGHAFPQPLTVLINRAIQLLDPHQEGPAIVGHGDAHNGNLFLMDGQLVYFDPAFAGSHHPLLDLVKPLYHNVFAQWMYFPAEFAEWLQVEAAIRDGRIDVRHNFRLHPLRLSILESKRQRTLAPMVEELRSRGWLRADWREYLNAALLCCPLLTMNLLDPAKFSPVVSLLGFAHAVEMGNEGVGA
jgi:hypothetical protein